MITGRGRPLRFVATIGVLWVSARIAMLWHATGSLPQAIERTLPIPRVVAAAHAPARPIAVAAGAPARTPIARGVTRATATIDVARADDPIRAQLALLAMTRFGQPIALADPSQVDAPAQPSVPTPISAHDPQPAARNRWSASGWLIVRPGSGAGASLGVAQLGGSQAGARIDYALGRGVALSGRVAAPLRGAGAELALGIAWQPARAPVRLVAEHRIAIDRGRGGPSLAAVGGVSDVALPAGFRLEGYAQAGVIARRGGEAYVDGLARAARPVAAARPADLDLGVGAWGGAQRGAARLDIGPTAALRLPIADRAVRMTLDWRQRVAGDARPGSGPALTLGSDF